MLGRGRNDTRDPMQRLALFVCLVYAFTFTAGGDLPVGAIELITEHEAKLPDEDAHSKGLSRGPKIILINPAPIAGFITSPFTLKVRFETFGSAKIDPEGIVMTYLKRPPIDLTQRIKSFIR